MRVHNRLLALEKIRQAKQAELERRVDRVVAKIIELLKRIEQGEDITLHPTIMDLLQQASVSPKR